MKPARDPRVKIMADIMLRVRGERAKRMITVGDMRRREGRVTIEEEAAEILSAFNALDKWQDAETAPQTGFFLAWSPDFPDMVSCWKAELFHQARLLGTPRHLSANHFTKWMPCELPALAARLRAAQ